MNYRDYNGLNRSTDGIEHNPEIDDFGFNRRRFGSGRYVRNEFDPISIRHDNPDLVKFSNNINSSVKRYDNACQNTSEGYNDCLVPSTYKYSVCECPGECKETNDMIGSYGVYCRRSVADDDGGFVQGENKNNYFAEHRVVVNSNRNGTTTNTLIDGGCGTKEEEKYADFCCFNETKMQTERNSHWYKSPIVFLLFAVTIAVIVMVSGLLLYFRYFGHSSYRTRIPVVEDPCEKKYCPYEAYCEVENNGQAVCKCNSNCPSNEDYVCGTDGVTYKNVCNLRATACQNKLNVRVQHANECHLSDPCRSHACQYGARCVPTPDGRNATCECPLSCPNYGDHSRSRPVCGADGRDYINHCELKKAACAATVNITIKYEGYCDPCVGRNVKCNEPEVCQLDADRNPVCRCSETCALEFAPVCGSDGKTYSNECSLRQQACRSRKNLRIIHRGVCGSGVNPCANVNCRHNEECIINKFGIAACECVSDCEPIIRPVCGTDGITYDSICHLQQSSCQLKINVTSAYNGACGERGVCANYRCDHGGECMPRGGQPQCECAVCSNEFDPVCGSDGATYGNLCKLQHEQCQHRRNINVLYQGLCNGCENKKCDFYAECESDGIGEAKCVCPASCPELQSPVCGSDGKTYSSECDLKMQSCAIQQLITVASKGKCDDCSGGDCKYRISCDSEPCDCPTDCDKDFAASAKNEPVCASDMNTYANECEMQKYACQKASKSLYVVFYGDCKERTNASVLLENVKESDTSDLDLVKPNAAKPKEVCQDILCDYDGTCELGSDGLPHCACIFDCSREQEKPICGSDLLIYPSICHMKLKSCQKQNEIRIRPIELCQGMEVKPCSGKNPIMDPLTHQELDCGSGPARRDCPSNTYCHHTSKFARCCPKDTGLYLKSCKDSWYGCCPDNKTPASGPDNLGCPSICNCNKLGSNSDSCDTETGQCKCKPGVGGLVCDRCEPGFWGLPKISSGHPGCLPCGCSLFGSVRDDCEQMTGRCVCKPEVQGPKCTVCSHVNKVLGPNGCVTADVSTPAPASCDELSCYFNATCEVHNGQAKCICHFTCPQDYYTNSQAVCGNDGQTYSSQCQLKLYSCRYQKDIAVQALSSCTDDYVSGTDGPRLGAWTSINHFTEPEYAVPPLLKSTRHVLISESRNYDFTPKLAGKNIANGNGDLVYNEVNSGKLQDLYHVINEPTAATVTALIGDLCTTNDDCIIENSHCVAGVCTCRPTFSTSGDKQLCPAEGITSAVKQRGCASNPCSNKGRCTDKPDGGFECICTSSFTGPTCETHVESRQSGIETPAFGGQSYIELKPLKAYHKFSMEIEFKSYTDNGILLYSQQRSDGAGDYISLAIVNGFAEFRYNLGNGPAILTSLQRLTSNSYHKIVTKRYQKDGILQVDNFESVAGQSEGTLKALDLTDNAFIGYVPINSNKIFENIGTSNGFVGCIRKLKIGRHTIKLKDKQDSTVAKIHDLKECSDLVNCHNSSNSCTCLGGVCDTETNQCTSNPCQHGALCEPLLQGSYTCNCLPGHRGNSCEIFEPSADDLYMPQFNGINSYIRFPCLESVRRGFSIEIWFLTTAMNGLLLYNGQLHNRRGDFISLNLVNGYVQFRYDLGSGIANITSENKVHLGSWQSVKVHRFDRVGSIQLNNGNIVKGTSGPALNELNLELSLFVGGVLTLSEVSRESGITEKFKGVIQRILINGKSLHLMSGEHINIVPYTNHPCSSIQTCFNGGICVPYLSHFLCKCTNSFSGPNCQNYTSGAEKNNQERGVYFNGNAFLQYLPEKPSTDLQISLTNTFMSSAGFSIDDNNNESVSGDLTEDENTESDYFDDMYDDTTDFDFFNDERKSRKLVQYELSLRTTQTSGLLLWSSKIRQSQRDYIAIAIIDGFIEFSHSFGKEQQVISVKSDDPISDGNWHSIHILHRKRITQITIDLKKPIKRHTEQIQRLHLSNGKIFIGGVPSIPADFPEKYVTGFTGCLKKLIIDKKRISITQLSYNSSVPVEYCEENDI